MAAVPFSRPHSVRHVGKGPVEVAIEADAAERAALAPEIGLVAIDRLVAKLRLEGRPDRVRVTGSVEADIVQACVVTLDPFPSRVQAKVDVAFREPSEREPRSAPGAEFEADLDAPDDLIDGRIDLGAVAAEFLALGLDPYPKKPGAVLDPNLALTGDASPFGALKALRDGDG